MIHITYTNLLCYYAGFKLFNSIANEIKYNYHNIVFN